MNAVDTVMDAARATFAAQRKLAERALDQIDEQQIFARQHDDANSIAALMKHVGGNLRSRWRDFLTTDGEKPDRQRDGEFEPDADDMQTIRQTWDRGWATLDDSLAQLHDADLGNTITIRGESMTAALALHRSLAHTAQHVGQIIILARAYRGTEWQTLSIPRGGSAAFLDEMQQRA